MQALRQFQANRTELSRSLIRLSTGQRINRGADDPAGLISSTQLSAALAALEAESRSLQRNNYTAATAEASLDEVSSLLRDSKGLEVQLANTGALGDAEQAAIQMQIDSNTQAIDRITASAAFNGQSLFNGSTTLSAGSEALPLPDLSTNGLGATDIAGQTFTLSDTASGGALTNNPSASSQVIDTAITQIATLRASIGAFQRNTLASTLQTNAIAFENLAQARSQIADTDFAEETATLARNTILDRASIKALGILIQAPARLMDLLN
jgi:flagellin